MKNLTMNPKETGIGLSFSGENLTMNLMGQQNPTHRSRPVGAIALVAVLLLAAAGTTNAAEWFSKPAPPLPLPVLDQQWQGSVMLRLMLEESGRVRNVQVVRSSGISALDDIAREGASKWRLDPGSVRSSDMTRGRDHIIKFYQDARVGKRVPPVKAYWVERTRF
jgi:TonB family protein